MLGYSTSFVPNTDRPQKILVLLFLFGFGFINEEVPRIFGLAWEAKLNNQILMRIGMMLWGMDINDSLIYERDLPLNEALEGTAGSSKFVLCLIANSQ